MLAPGILPGPWGVPGACGGAPDAISGERAVYMDAPERGAVQISKQAGSGKRRAKPKAMGLIWKHFYVPLPAASFTIG